jgi:hypothetical protein
MGGRGEPWLTRAVAPIENLLGWRPARSPTPLAQPFLPPDFALVSQDSAIDPTLALVLAQHSHAREDERQRMLKRLGAALAVALVHVLIVALLVSAGRVRHISLAQPKEVQLILPALQPERSNASPPVVLPENRPEQAPSATITLPAPQKPAKSQSDIMQAIGKELACGAGSYENLSQAQREACRRQPWKFKKNAKGVIVLDVSPPPADNSQSGADQVIHTLQTNDPCLAAGNTHSECIHKNLFGR